MIVYGDPVFFVRSSPKAEKAKGKGAGKGNGKGKGIGGGGGFAVGQDPAAPGIAQPSLVVASGYGNNYGSNYGAI
jgi:hypothetical protein